MKFVEKVKEMSNKKKGIIVGACVAVLAVGGFGYKAYADYSYKQKVQESQSEADAKTKELDGLVISLKGLKEDEKSPFLAEEATLEDVKEYEKEYKDTKKGFTAISRDVDLSNFNRACSDVEKLIEELEHKLIVQNEVNALFGVDNPAIVGSKTNEDAPVKDDLKKDEVQAIKEKYHNSNRNTNAWKFAIDTCINNAESQVSNIEFAKEFVEVVFKDNKVILAEKGAYDRAKERVDKIKNQKAKKDLSSKLEKVKNEIDKKTKELEDRLNETLKDAGLDTESSIETQGNNVNQSNVNEGQSSNGNESVSENVGSGYVDYGSGNTNSGAVVPSAGNGNVTGSNSVSSNNNSGGSSANSNNSSVNSGNNSGNTVEQPTPTPPQSQQYTGWWNDGSTLHSAGTFGTEGEALAAAKALYIQNGRVGSYGASQG